MASPFPWKSDLYLVNAKICALSSAASCTHWCSARLSTVRGTTVRARSATSNWSLKALASALQNSGAYSLHAVWNYPRLLRPRAICVGYGRLESAHENMTSWLRYCAPPLPLQKGLQITFWLLLQQAHQCRSPYTCFLFIFWACWMFTQEQAAVSKMECSKYTGFEARMLSLVCIGGVLCW